MMNKCLCQSQKLVSSSHFSHPENPLYHWNCFLILQNMHMGWKSLLENSTMLVILHSYPKHIIDPCNTLLPTLAFFWPVIHHWVPKFHFYPHQKHVTSPKMLSLVLLQSFHQSQGSTSNLSDASRVHSGHQNFCTSVSLSIKGEDREWTKWMSQPHLLLVQSLLSLFGRYASWVFACLKFFLKSVEKVQFILIRWVAQFFCFAFVF